jgi:3-polyprenyl-4-hydroxybenzoate decarboxylase
VLDACIPEELGGWWLLLRVAAKEQGSGGAGGAAVIKTIGGLADEIALPRWIVVVGPDADLGNIDDALFHWMANTAPDRDRYLSKCGRRTAFDATPKNPGEVINGLPVRDWPPILSLRGKSNR